MQLYVLQTLRTPSPPADVSSGGLGRRAGSAADVSPRGQWASAGRGRGRPAWGVTVTTARAAGLTGVCREEGEVMAS